MNDRELLKGRVVARIRKMMKDHKVSVRKLALDADVDSAQISKILSGDRLPTLPILAKLAKGFGVTISELLEGV